MRIRRPPPRLEDYTEVGLVKSVSAEASAPPSATMPRCYMVKKTAASNRYPGWGASPSTPSRPQSPTGGSVAPQSPEPPLYRPLSTVITSTTHSEYPRVSVLGPAPPAAARGARRGGTALPQVVHGWPRDEHLPLMHAYFMSCPDAGYFEAWIELLRSFLVFSVIPLWNPKQYDHSFLKNLRARVMDSLVTHNF